MSDSALLQKLAQVIHKTLLRSFSVSAVIAHHTSQGSEGGPPTFNYTSLRLAWESICHCDNVDIFKMWLLLILKYIHMQQQYYIYISFPISLFYLLYAFMIFYGFLPMVIGSLSLNSYTYSKILFADIIRCLGSSFSPILPIYLSLHCKHV